MVKLLPPKDYNIFIKILWYLLLIVILFTLVKTSIDLFKNLAVMFYVWCCYRVTDANEHFYTYTKN